MVANTLEYEQQQVAAAEREYQEAYRKFNMHLDALKAVTETYIGKIVDYKLSRKFWVEL